MQILAHYSIEDYAKFKTAFDEDAEDRANNSLTVLQLWRETNGSVWVLYDAHDDARAKDYLEEAGQVFYRLAGISESELHMLEIA